MKTIWQIGRAGVTRTFRNHVLAIARAWRSALRLSAFALASAMLVVSFGAAQAQIPTNITVTVTPNPVVLESTGVVIQINVAGGSGALSPTGNVSVSVTDPFNTFPPTVVALSPSFGGFSLASLSDSLGNNAGTNTITVTYGGDANFAGSTASFDETVLKANTTMTLVASQSSVNFGQPATFTATVSGAPPTHESPFPGGCAESVSFFDNGNPLGPVPLTVTGPATSAAVLTLSTLAAGSHSITATYGGSCNFNPPAQQPPAVNTTVLGNAAAQPPTILKMFGNSPITLGQSTTLIFTITNPNASQLTGVGFTDPFPIGLVVATPNGQTGTCGGGTITATAGSGSVNLSNATLAGNASCTFLFNVKTTSTGVFSNTTGAVMSNEGGNGLTSTASLTVNPVNATATTTNVTSTQNPSVFGQPVTFTATVSGNGGTPTGTVTFTIDGTPGSPINLVNGVATFSTSTLTVAGSPHSISAAYSGDGVTFLGSNGSLAGGQTVNPANTTITLTSSQNPSAVFQGIGFTATVSPVAPGAGTPGGTVTFTIDGNVQPANTLTNGTVTFSTPGLTLGSHMISVVYNGDPNFNKSGPASLTQVVVGGQTITQLASSQNPSASGQPVTFTATVSRVSGNAVAPTGPVVFSDNGTPIGTVTLQTSGGFTTATLTTAALTIGSHTITATYGGDSNFVGSSATLQQGVNKGTTATTLTASPNPSTPGQQVTFTATVSVASGAGTPTGTVTFKDGAATTLGTGTVGAGGLATFTTSALTPGSHTITAVYGGDTNFTGSTSAPLLEQVGPPADSVRLRELQISATPIIANVWGQAVTGAMDDAVSAGFGGNPQSLSPAGTGFTYYFNDDPPARPTADADQDSLRRYLASPTGSLTSPNGNTNTAATDSVRRVDDDFRTLGYAGGMPTKAPPPASAGAPRDWLAWINVRGTDYFRGTFGNDLKGDQVDAFSGVTRRISPNFVVGAFGGYEHFDYSSQAFNGFLKGDGWTVGTYLGWKLSPNVRFDAGGAWSDLLANGVSGSASGHFVGTRWLINGGLTGTYPWQQLVFEPSARVFALWEHENAYTDSLGTFQPARSFETGRASAGVKAIYPLAWTTSVVALSPYAGIYADYYFSKDDAQTVGLTTVPLLQGFSARATGGVAASFAGGATLGAGGEFGGIGSQNHIWTWTARGRIPF